MMQNRDPHLFEQEDLPEIRHESYVHYLNLLLFCGTVFIFGFVRGYVDGMPVSSLDRPSRVTQPIELELPPELQELHSQINSTLGQELKLPDLRSEVQGDKIEIHITAGDLFLPGQAELAGQTEERLARFARALLPVSEKHYFEIEGHTDDVPVVKNAWKYPTNWELSSARASRILRVFVKNGHREERLKVSGRSGVEPLHPNRGPANEPIYGNQIKNRRLVIRIGKEL